MQKQQKQKTKNKKTYKCLSGMISKNYISMMKQMNPYYGYYRTQVNTESCSLGLEKF